MHRFSKIFLFFCLLISAPVYASREVTIVYKGLIESKGNILDQVASFKFALCDKDCAISFWSNDNKSVAGSEPVDYVAVPISKGVFNVLLGDTLERMEAIPVSIFHDIGDRNIYLRVWVNDGVNGFEQLVPDQRVSIVPYTARAETMGDLFNTGSLTMTGGLAMTGNLSIQMDSSTTGTTPFQVGSADTTFFSVDNTGKATSRSIVLQPLTSSSDLSRTETGRIFYDGVANRFMGCNATTCSEIGLAGPTGVGDITSVTSGAGLSGGGTTGAITLSVDTDVVVTKSGNHTITGSLTAAELSSPIVQATTLYANSMSATGVASANSVSVSGTTTTAGMILSPTGIDAGNTAELRLKELAAEGSQYVGFKAPDSIEDNTIWTLPTADGASGQVIETNGLGVLGWITPKTGDITNVIAGDGISGSVSGAGVASLSIGPGFGIKVSADNVLVNMITLADGTGATSSFSGMEPAGPESSQLALLQGCSNNQTLKWNESASTWGCASVVPSTETVTDSTLLELTTGVLVEVMNDAEPFIAMNSETNRIWVSGSILLSSVAVGVETTTFYVYRGNVDDTICDDGGQVGAVAYTTSDAGTFYLPFSFIDSPGTTAPEYYTVCGYTDSGTPTTAEIVMLTIQEVAPAGADLAELYPTTDTTIQAGTVVSLDSGLALGVKKSPHPYDKSVLGVISTDPGLLLDDGVNSGAAVPVALSGRVPVQVTTHEGKDPIAIGDYLTTSEIPGVAMKATRSGTVIGKAISQQASGLGYVFMFVEQGYLNIPDDSLAGSVETDAEGLATVSFKNAIGADKPNVQLTVESVTPAFAQVSEFLANGFVVKTFAPTGAIAPKVMVHYQVVVKEGSHD